MLTVEEINAADQWHELISQWHGHPLQEWQWGDLKAATGPWTAHRVVCSEDGQPAGCAQILVRRLPWPFGAICYAPRGPVAADEARLPELADACADWCRRHVNAVSLKIDPAVTELNLSDSWKPSEYVLLAKTGVIDLTRPEDEIFQGLHSKKARQYIRKAGREGVTCRPATREDLDAILAIYHQTAANDHFNIHPDEFYRTAFDVLGEESQLFVAEYDGRIQSFLWNATTSGTAFELWGGVTDEGKKLRANYILKWTAITAAKAYGAQLYDLNGLLNDGISDFKLLFVNGETNWVGCFDRPLSWKYTAWNAVFAARRKLRGLRAGTKH